MSNEKFEYTYNAQQREEIKKIQDKYAPAPVSSEQDKLERLRKLDHQTTQ